MRKTFEKGSVVVAKDEYVERHETLRETAGIVIDHNPDNDFLLLGVLNPERYAIAPTFSMRGEYYRLATPEELAEWNGLART